MADICFDTCTCGSVVVSDATAVADLKAEVDRLREQRDEATILMEKATKTVEKLKNKNAKQVQVIKSLDVDIYRLSMALHDLVDAVEGPSFHEYVPIALRHAKSVLGKFNGN